jgi:hypothetical protein
VDRNTTQRRHCLLVWVAKADFIAATMVQPDKVTRGLMLLPELINPVFEGVEIELVFKGKGFLRLPAALPLCNQFTHVILSFYIHYIKYFFAKISLQIISDKMLMGGGIRKNRDF